MLAFETSKRRIEMSFEMSPPARRAAGARAASPGAPPQVDDLKATLAIQEAELVQKNENADKLIHVVGVETEKVSKEKAIADEEEIKVEVINKVGGSRQRAFPAWSPQRQRVPGAAGPSSGTPPPGLRRGQR